MNIRTKNMFSQTYCYYVWRTYDNKFQESIKKDVKMIRINKQLLVAADKTTNYYKLQINESMKLKKNSIRKTYKKRNINDVINSINKETNYIIRDLKLEKKIINQLPLKQCYVTLKDHKKIFFQNQIPDL